MLKPKALKKNTLYFIALLLFCGGPAIYSLVSRQEIFPWSSFPMYSGRNTGKDFYLLSAYLKTEAHTEEAIEKTGIIRPKYEYRYRLNAKKKWDEEITPQEQELLHRFAEIFQEDLKSHPVKFKAIRFYLEYWESFQGPQRFHPDQKRLIYEYPLE